MSQYHITAGQHKIIIGWDRPRCTYFASVRDQTKGGDQSLVLWVGTNRGELRSVDALEAALASYVELAPELRSRLEVDMLEDFGFPIIGYIYDNRGYHGGKVWIHSKDQLNLFMAGPVRQARLENREVRITDGGDFMIYHSEKGQLIWPR